MPGRWLISQEVSKIELQVKLTELDEKMLLVQFGEKSLKLLGSYEG